MSKYADYEFVIRCIKSCKTVKQIRTPITNLMRSFHEKHSDFDLWVKLKDERDAFFLTMIETDLNKLKIIDDANRIYSRN